MKNKLLAVILLSLCFISNVCMASPIVGNTIKGQYNKDEWKAENWEKIGKTNIGTLTADLNSIHSITSKDKKFTYIVVCVEEYFTNPYALKRIRDVTNCPDISALREDYVFHIDTESFTVPTRIFYDDIDREQYYPDIDKRWFLVKNNQKAKVIFKYLTKYLKEHPKTKTQDNYFENI